MRGKMRFWSKTKHSEKKLSREKQASMSEVGETPGKKNKYIYLVFIVYTLVLNHLFVSTLLLGQRVILLLAVSIWRQRLPGASRTVRRTRSHPQR